MSDTGRIYIANDLSKEVLEHMREQVQIALQACGTIAEGYAKDDCPVDTGRLRNSITWAIKDKQSTPNTSGGEPAKSEDYKKLAEPEKSTLYIGTNVEYAQDQEYNTSYSHKVGKAHFLKDSLANHGEEFKRTLEAALKA